MDLLHIILLALVQGITEFLPISSSAHLILLPQLSGWEDQGLALDVAAHVGSLFAVIGYFRGDLWLMGSEWWRSLQGGPTTARSRLVWAIGLATLPLALIGLLIHGAVESVLRHPLVIAAATIGFGLLLWFADRRVAANRDEMDLRARDIIIIGLAQALALIPGTSRSGITITAGLMMGLSRKAAARFSFLLAIPAILIAGGYQGLGLILSGAAADWGAILLVTVLSGLSAYLCIHYFLKLLDRIGMLPFVIYRLLLGGILLWFYFPSF